MTATLLPLSLAQRHNNQQLFSDHYLNVSLPQRPEWKLFAHDAGQALAQIAPIVRAYMPSDNEAQTEEELIRPVLRVLEHTFEVQATLKQIYDHSLIVLYRLLFILYAEARVLLPLREGYAEQGAPVQQRQAEALKLERRLADLVNQAYGLTPEEVDLLWRTAPPRMPVGQAGEHTSRSCRFANTHLYQVRSSPIICCRRLIRSAKRRPSSLRLSVSMQQMRSISSGSSS